MGAGTWTYDPVKKHAVRTAGAYTFSYDNNGNMTGNGAGDSGTWTSYNLPSLIQGSSATGTASSRFFHGPDRQRYKQEAVYGPMAQTTRYLGGLVEQVSSGASTQWKHAILTPVGVVGLHTRSSDGTNETLYFTKDHLGSIDTISNTAGSVLIRLSYDAFGKRRKEAGWSGSVSSAEHQTINATSHRGYTGHEMLDHLGLIHMNGRVYHAEIGRFLSADPYIDGALNTQGWNRYAYVKNSPLSFVDPTGFCESSAGPMGPETMISSTCSASLSGMAYALYVFDTITHSRPSLSSCIGCPRTPLDHLDDDNGTTPSAGGGKGISFWGSTLTNGRNNDLFAPYDAQLGPSSSYACAQIGACGNRGDVSPDQAITETLTVGGIVTTGVFSAEIGAVTVAGWNGAKTAARNASFDGPSSGLLYGEGRIFGVRWKGNQWGFRLDLHTLGRGPEARRVLHINFGSPYGKEGAHIPLFDPRWFRFGE